MWLCGKQMRATVLKLLVKQDIKQVRCTRMRHGRCTYLQESEGYVKYNATSYKGRIGERQEKQVGHDHDCVLATDVFSFIHQSE